MSKCKYHFDTYSSGSHASNGGEDSNFCRVVCLIIDEMLHLETGDKLNFELEIIKEGE